MRDFAIGFIDNDDHLRFPREFPDLAGEDWWSVLTYNEEQDRWVPVADGLTVAEAERAARELGYAGVPVGGLEAV